MGHTMKIVLDTDIGSDIDDAVCLAYLLHQPRCDLLGITTVSGESDKRAQIASAICTQAGQSIPIVPGIAHPLTGTTRQPKAQQATQLSNWKHATQFPERDPVAFLQKVIRQHPHEITLLTIGPLTNIAALIRDDPEIPHLIHELVLMGGMYFQETSHRGQPGEWNILCDPTAAAEVFDAAFPKVRCIGLDVTLQVQLTKAEVEQQFTHPLLHCVLDFARVWFENTDRITFHDPLAAVCLFESVCAFKQGNVKVNTDQSNSFSVGRTTFYSLDQLSDSPKEKLHWVAHQVDRSAFFNHYFGVFNR
jgi:purine nucleosidase